jgi:hypothetical protein
MMRVPILVGLSLCAAVALSACQPQKALPTVINLEGAQTIAASTQAAQPTPTPTATAARQLPPTFTPTPSETPAPTFTPLASQDMGRLYYLYNDDSIASVKADGTDNTIVVTLGVGQAISEYAISPDRTRIAFVAPGGGSGREVYISKIDGTDIQKMSCLGMNDMRSLVWTPSGTQMVLFAAPVPGAAGNLYLIQTTKQNTSALGCPEASSSRVLAPLQTSDFRGMTLNREGTLLYYAGGGSSIYVWDMATNNRYLASTDSPLGPDNAPRQNPITDELVFIRQGYRGSTTSGTLVSIQDSSVPPLAPIADVGDPYDALDLRWSGDGTLLLLTTAAGILYFDTEEKRIVTLPLSALRLPEAAAARRDAIAYTGFDDKNVAQIFIYDLNRESSRQVTQNPDGTIRSLVWLGPS